MNSKSLFHKNIKYKNNHENEEMIKVKHRINLNNKDGDREKITLL